MRSLAFVCVLGFAAVAYGQSAADLQKQLNAHAKTIEGWAADKAIVDAVRAQNAKHVSLAEIQKQDAAWIAGKNAALVQAVTRNPCSDRLRALTAQLGYGEAFISDGQGALACATDRTSDYWQGDEDKWIKAFNKGLGAVFIDRPRRDDSASTNLAQISVPIVVDKKVIGVITVGVPPKSAH